MVCTKLLLVLPHPSVKFQVRTLWYAFAQVAFGVVTSLTKLIVGVVVQLSVATGTEAKAVEIDAASEHSKVTSKLVAAVVTTGAVVS